MRFNHRIHLPNQVIFTMLLATLLSISSVTATAQDRPPAPPSETAESSDSTVESSDATPPRPLEIHDAALWERLTGFSMSNDGQWCGYQNRRNEGDGQVVIRQVEGDVSHEFEVGPGTGSPIFSHDSKWVAFVFRALQADADAATKSRKPVPTKIVLIKLEDGSQQEFEDATSFSFGGERADWLAVRKQRAASPAPNENGFNGTDLVLHHLDQDEQLNFGNVSEYSFNKGGTHLAMLIDAQGKFGNGLHLFDATSNRIEVLDSQNHRFKRLAWNEAGDSLACLVEVDSDKHEEKLHHLIAYRDVTGAAPHRVFLDMANDPGVAEHLTISPNSTPSWTENKSGLMFGVHDARPKPEDDEEAKPDGEEEADLVVWHWQDERMQSQQQVQESADKRFNYRCIHRVNAGVTFQLADDEIRSVSIAKPHRFAIGTDNSRYELDGNLHGRRFRDVYVIDLETGRKRLALEKNRWSYGVSPSGDRLLYYQDGHFHVYDLVTGDTRNITEGLPTSFIDTENDANVEDPPIRPLGWTQDGSSVLLSDNWDLWRVAAAGGESVNLTVNGKEEGIRYSRVFDLDPEEDGIDLSRTAYVAAYGEWTKESGIGRLQPGESGIEMLLWDNVRFLGLGKVKDLETYYYSRDSQNKSVEYFVTGPELADGRLVTESNAHQDKYLWSDGVKLIDYESKSGDRLQGALFLPADYVEGRSYPTIVYIYEKLSQRANSYDAPRVGGFSTAIYTSQGYAVLMPDIVYRVNDPGLSSVECVLPAVEAAVASGIVDAERIGLHGHSWGGYQTSFLITQTDTFKAAVAGAPLTNLISMYSSIYWNSGSANQPIFESSQGRFTGGYWTNIRAYTRNSPVYFARRVNTPLLLLHNDQDGAVDWNQGIEYFNTLRRLRKPVVMLQYKGENHGLANLANRKDYSYRMLDFFDHYLRDEDAPDWWADGVDHLDMQDHIRDYRQESEEAAGKSD